MRRNSSLYPIYFQFTVFSDYGPLKYLFFTLSLLTYLTIIFVNVVIILAVCLEKSLHQPMYIFICCLSFNSLYSSVGFFPRFLMDIVSDTHFISFQACVIQTYFITTYLVQELTFLTVMAYDRFVAICQPLHYHSKMTLRRVKLLVFMSVLFPAVLIGAFTQKFYFVTFCGNTMNRMICTGGDLILLSCEKDSSMVNTAGQTMTLTTTLSAIFFSFFTYLRILLVCRRSSSEVRGKAFQTCLPHIVTFLSYCVSVLCDFYLSRYNPGEANTVVIVVLSLEIVLIPPINNPFVYGLTLPRIRGVIFRRLKIHK
ncbi:olfactory receptor 10H28-like [Halichoeres trimaculatus]|uniref:olfactory receptor 10H28-like n=1 Tax=Halichoeres trimaculatus TaxID=147232 RepID=UPI003D9DE219